MGEQRVLLRVSIRIKVKLTQRKGRGKIDAILSRIPHAARSAIQDSLAIRASRAHILASNLIKISCSGSIGSILTSAFWLRFSVSFVPNAFIQQVWHRGGKWSYKSSWKWFLKRLFKRRKKGKCISRQIMIILIIKCAKLFIFDQLLSGCKVRKGDFPLVVNCFLRRLVPSCLDSY